MASLKRASLPKQAGPGTTTQTSIMSSLVPKRPLSDTADAGGAAPTSEPKNPKKKKARLSDDFQLADFRAGLDKEQSANGAPSQADLLALECDTIGSTWLPYLHKELTKPYFTELKRFLWQEGVRYAPSSTSSSSSSSSSDPAAAKKVFPAPQDIYSWSKHTRLDKLKVVILGQDPYHNIGQAHGLAFSVQPGVKVPPSLVNIYKEVKANYPDFTIPKHGFLGAWASQGVLLLNTCLTVRAHQANSHAQQGWEEFTQAVIDTVNQHGGEGLSSSDDNDSDDAGVVFLAWGKPAEKRVVSVNKKKHLILTSPHPSPLSAARGFHGNKHFIQANEWLEQRHGPEAKVDWTKLDLPSETPATN